MSESKSSSSSVKSQRLSMLDSDMAAAAQQLIQLSDEDNNSNNSNSKKKLIKRQSQDEITCAKIEEIFGKEDDDDEIPRPPKKRKYRLLEDIYKETKPIKVPLLPRALRNRSDHIDIPSTQRRSSKGYRRLTKARKLGSFRKWILIRKVHEPLVRVVVAILL